MTAALTVSALAPIVKVAAVELPAATLDSLRGMRIHRSLGIPARCTLDLTDVGFAESAGTRLALGTAVEVSTSPGTVRGAGEITGVHLELDASGPLISVECHDAAYRMTLESKVRTFTNVTYGAVLTQIAGEAGLSAEVGEFNGSTTTWPYLLQSDTDFGFVSELAERTGSDWWIEERTLHFKAPASAAPVLNLSFDPAQRTPGSLSRFSVHASMLHPTKATVQGWSPQLKAEVAGTAEGTTGVPVANANLVLKAVSPERPAPVVTVESAPMDQAEAEVLAKRLVTRWGTGAVTAKGVCTVAPTLQPGVAVSVAGVGPANGTYHLTEVEHVYSKRGFETRFTAGDRAPSGLVDTLQGGATTSSFRRDGVVIGVVTALGPGSDGEAGQVKVKFSALGQIESAWARVVTVGGGSRRGVTFLPEINDEVLVGFESGDVRRPVVIGGLFNGQDIAEEYGVENNAISKRRLTSRLGHFVELGDGTSPATQHVLMQLAGGTHSVRLGKDKLVGSVPAGTPVTLQSGSSKIEIADDGSITIKGFKISLIADTDVTVEGLNITHKAKVKAATSAMQVETSATATAKLSATGMVVVSGAMVKVK